MARKKGTRVKKAMEKINANVDGTNMLGDILIRILNLSQTLVSHRVIVKRVGVKRIQ